jgi:RNA polymerase-binding transcription factor DksA
VTASTPQRNDEVNLEEEGTDAFMRLQTLEQVGTQQGVVIKINEALDAIAKGMYGVCDNCNELITKARLAVLPFARTCIKCQAELEQADRHGRRR